MGVQLPAAPADKKRESIMSSVAFGPSVWDLPPLILHPFNERAPPAELLDSSKAGLILAGLIAEDGSEAEELERKVLNGRYAEIRMLFYIGKDVMRWISQSIEHISAIVELREAGIQPQSLAGLLTSGAPEPVKAKLHLWGVADYASIFGRAIGLNSVFREPPPVVSLAPEFLRNYHKVADRLFACYMETAPHTTITAANFRFDLYASGEYSRMLEAQWSAQDAG
jgi:hypothetical protein